MIIGIQLGSWRTHLCFYIDNAEKLVNDLTILYLISWLKETPSQKTT